MTSFQEVYTAFYDKVEKDKDFFLYRNVDEDTTKQIIETRANSCLMDAISYIMVKAPTVNLYDYDGANNCFNFDLSSLEIQLLAQTMLLMYFQREFAKLKAFQVKFGVKDVNQFSPANERKTFTEMYMLIQKNTDLMIQNYAMRDWTTNEYIGIDYSKYNGDS